MANFAFVHFAVCFNTNNIQQGIPYKLLNLRYQSATRLFKNGYK